jgi:hypothetical protein
MNYQNGKIYKIVDNTNDDIYIGSTTQKTLAQRLSQHVSQAKSNKRHCSSKQIILNGDYDMVLIELFPCHSKDELHARERHYIETINCVNKVIPTRTQAEWCQDNKEIIMQKRIEYYQNTIEHRKQYNENNKEHRKQYNKNNKEQIKQRKANYAQKNKEKIKQYQKEYYEKHKESKKQYDEKYYEQNKEKIKQKSAEYRQKLKNKVNENNI